MKLLPIIALALGVLAVVRPVHSQPTLREDHGEATYNIELASGRSIFARSLERTVHDELYARELDGERHLMRSREVERITYLSTPLEPARVINWDSIPVYCEECYCTDLEAGSHFFEGHVGANYRGDLTYTRQTIAGPETVNAGGFGSNSENGTIGSFQGDIAGGWRWERWRAGLMAGVMPSDGALFIPVALHGAYDLQTNFLGTCPNLFANAGIPFDFKTHAPIFFSSFQRTRKFFSAGIGFERPMSTSSNLSIDLGWQYMTVPLSEVQCCPDLPFQDHFPTRSISGFFGAIGLSF